MLGRDFVLSTMTATLTYLVLEDTLSRPWPLLIAVTLWTVLATTTSDTPE